MQQLLRNQNTTVIWCFTDMPNLFKFNDALSEVAFASPTISTPLGTISVELSIGAFSTNTAAGQLYKHKNSISHYTWPNPIFNAELILTPLVFRHESPLSEDSGRIAIWRVQAHQHTEPLDFKLSWLPGYLWNEVGPSTGEGLDCRCWSNGDREVYAGTEDEIWLLRRARNSDRIPQSWDHILNEQSSRFVTKYYAVETGSTVNLPSLDAGELCQVHFAVSYCENIALRGDAEIAAEPYIPQVFQKFGIG